MSDLDDDVFSADEQKFFETGGVEAGKLFEPAPAKEQAAPAETVGKTQEKAPADPDEAGAVDLEDNGRVRDVKSGRYVPVGVLRETREQLKETKQKLSAAEQVQQKFLSVLERFAGPGTSQQQQVPAQRAEPVKLIDPEQDLIGAIKQDRVLREQAEKARLDSERAIRAQLQDNERNGVMTREISTFRAKTPDFDEAMQTLASVRERHHGRLYANRNADGSPNPEKVRAAVAADIKGVVEDALAGRANPGEALYEWAKEFGYQKKEVAILDPAKQAAQATSAAAQQTDKTPAQQALEAISAGSDGARTLANAGGGASSGLTADAFLAMSEDEIYARLHGNPGFQAEIDRVLGKRA